MNKEILEQTLREAREAYYSDGSSILSDDEYDALEEQLRLVDPDNELLKEIGAKPVSNWERVKHTIPMGSLNKVQNYEQYDKWANTYNNTIPVILSEKLDGMSIAIHYVDGKFVQALTRGDGNIGEDISSNVKRMKNVPSKLPFNWTGWLRGEIILYKDDWTKYLSDKKNPRNAATGTAKRFDGEGCEHLTVLFYSVHSQDVFITRHNMFGFIVHELELQTPNVIGPIPANLAESYLNEWQSNRDKLPYEIDGMVIDINNLEHQSELGVVDGRPKGAVAYKFPPQMKVTTVKDITWQIGRTGRITPVAELEPVDIGGITISRVSLHTASIAIKSKAGPGSQVTISRRNDVIPYIENVIKGTESEVHLPTNLGETKWDGEYLVLKQIDGKTDLINSVKTWVERLRILHWGESFIGMLVEYGLIKTLGDIYRLDWNKVAALSGDGIAKRAHESLQSKGTKITFTSFVAALNIRYCHHSAEILTDNGINTIETLISVTKDQLQSFAGIGTTKAKEISESIQLRSATIKDIAQFIAFEKTGGPLDGLSFCFTGAMKNQRFDLENMVKDNGGKAKSSVVKGLTYLVMADPTLETTKAKKARATGVKCISEDEFLKMVKK